MANVRVIAVEEDNRTLEQLAVLNTLTLVNPKQSMWEKTSAGEIRVGYSLFSNYGSWSLKIATDALSNANLTTANLELVPTPADNYPDTYWTRNGQDLIPRS